MAIAFLSPWWLIAAVAVSGLALLAVWSLGLSPMPTSTLRFWQSAASSTGRQASRSIDPLWLLVALAAAMASLALLQPVLKTFPPQPATPQPPTIISAGAAIPHAHVGSIFVRSQALVKTPGPLVLRIRWPGGQRTSRISARQLQLGITVTGMSTGARIWNLALTAAGNAIWQQALHRQTPLTVAVNFLGSPPPPLVRLFALMKGVSVNRPELHPALWILSSTNARLSRTSLAHGDAVLAIAPAVLPGVILRSPHAGLATNGRAMPRLQLEKSRPSRLLAHLQFHHVGFRRFFKAKLNASWQVLATAAGGGLGRHPWPFIAQRYEIARRIRQLWVAVPLNFSSSHWPRHSSFVLFFANLLQRLRPHSAADMSVTRWVAPPTPFQLSTAAARGHARPLIISLSGWLALAAGGLVMVAMVGFIWRFRPVRAAL